MYKRQVDSILDWARENHIACFMLDATHVPGVADQLVQAILKRDLSTKLGRCLAAVVDKVDTTQAAAVAKTLVQAILKTDIPNQLVALTTGLATAAGKVDATQAAAVAEKLVQAMIKSDTPNQFIALTCLLYTSPSPRD